MRRPAIALLTLVLSFSIAAQEFKVVQLESAGIAANLIGEKGTQSVAIWVPPAYEKEPQRRFPVLYLLHGIGGGIGDFTKVWDVRKAMARAVAEREQYIVVMPNGANQFGGSFYADSPVTGKWATYIADELVAYVDKNYRTIADAAHRGISGHSMGGYGALTLAMERPDVFGASYAISPCCLALVEDLGYGNPSWYKALAFKGPADVLKSLQANDFYPAAIAAFGMATAPDPSSPSLMQFPVVQQRGELLPTDAYRQWEDNMPLARVAARRGALRSLRALGLEYGTRDQFAHIPVATSMFAQELARQRIPHTLDVYDGDHRAAMDDRLAEHVLPFFAKAFRD